MIVINRNPSSQDLRQFGVLWLVFFTAIGAMVWYRTDSEVVTVLIWVAALIIGVLGFVFLNFMRLVYLGMICLAFPIGWVISHVVLATVYYVVLSPIALILRIARYDPLGKRPDGSRESYWVKLPEIEDSGRYFRQF